MRSKLLIHAFSRLGAHFRENPSDLKEAKLKAERENPWFTPDNLDYALNVWAELLTEQSLTSWINHYSGIIPNKNIKTVGIIMAGNIPLAGFHDLLSVLISGHHALVKSSSDDSVLIHHIIDFLLKQEGLEQSIREADRLGQFDAVIATGSNNSSRYFEYYFGKYPHILRKNRSSAAVITGNESPETLAKLGDDIFRYFGLGCRNVSKIFIPEGFKPDTFFEAIFPYGDVIDHNKYANNHDYCRAIYLMNSDPFLDNNFLILKESTELHSPISVIYYERYSSLGELQQKLDDLSGELQCIAGESGLIRNEIPFGSTQLPALNDYADGKDTLEFLAGL